MFASVQVLSRQISSSRNVTSRRLLSTRHLDPCIRDFTAKLVEKQPSFTLPPSCTSILSEPSHFYTRLLEMIQRAQSRIFISSLYIGSAESELIDALDKALRDKPSLQLHLQLDLNRSTRPGASSTAKILLPLVRAHPSRVHVSMFRSPSLRGLMAKLVPPRFNEGWGTWHAKIYGVDDEVMISGANLNKSYFTNRQDRYIHFTNRKDLAQYCFDFLQTVATFSYKLLPSGLQGPTSAPNPHSYEKEGYRLHWPDPQTHPHHIHRKAELALTSLQQTHHRASSASSMGRTSTDDSIILVPVIQAGQFDIKEEETTLRQLFEHLQFAYKSLNSSSPRPLLDLTSGYFGLYKPYQDLILATSNVDTRIVAASPKANGFYGSSGISGRIPEGYTLLEQRFMNAVRNAGRSWALKGKGDEGGVQLNEWERPGWTYHAKGLWLSPTPNTLPILTLFGSTNLNSRSAHIDTELSFIMILPSLPASAVDDTSIVTLRKQLAAEIQDIRSHAGMWKGAQRKVRFWTKVIVQIVKGML